MKTAFRPHVPTVPVIWTTYIMTDGGIASIESNFLWDFRFVQLSISRVIFFFLLVLLLRCCYRWNSHRQEFWVKEVKLRLLYLGLLSTFLRERRVEISWAQKRTKRRSNRNPVRMDRRSSKDTAALVLQDRDARKDAITTYVITPAAKPPICRKNSENGIIWCFESRTNENMGKMRALFSFL